MTRLPLLAQQLNSLRPRSQTLVVFFFFFQAEDGIRDVAVTGFRRVLFRSNAMLQPGMCSVRRNTFRVATWRFASRASRRLADSIHSFVWPVTTWMSAGACNNRVGRWEIGRASCREGGWWARGEGLRDTQAR